MNIAAALTAACVLVSQTAPPVDVAIIIDDIGYDYPNGRAAVEIHHPFAYAVLPFSPHAKSLARLANSLDKDVIVHLPMEADTYNHALGPGALRMEMTREEISLALTQSLDAVPHAVGINNHMGSRLTREANSMSWLMQAIVDRGGLFFIDSRTTSDSIALTAALSADLSATARDVFIDNVKSYEAIERQLAVLIERAKTAGHALGIAHPHAVTVDVLRAWQPADAGVRVIALEIYMANYRRGRTRTAAGSEPAPTSECGDERNHASATEYPDG